MISVRSEIGPPWKDDSEILRWLKQLATSNDELLGFGGRDAIESEMANGERRTANVERRTPTLLKQELFSKSPAPVRRTLNVERRT
jgi:hypothetical protein